MLCSSDEIKRWPNWDIEKDIGMKMVQNGKKYLSV